MDAYDVQQHTLERLRANAARAGVTLTAEEIDRIVAGPFLGNVDAFVRLVEQTPSDTIPDDLKDWNDWSLAATDGAPSVPVSTAGADALDPFAPLYVVAAAIATRQVSPVAVTALMLERIAQYDSALNAFQVVLAEQAQADAAAAERRIMAGEARGPLDGVPVAVKDLLAMRGLPTTAGSTILAGAIADEDATAVQRLRQAGTVIVGKTRMSEFAYSPGSNNAHYGATHNPWHRDYDTGGSSSGSGAAVAAGLAFMALGSDTGGSIRIPGALCGIVGLKPTFGRVSLAGAVTLSWSMDHLGPMTRTVRDAALTLNLLAGHDPRDPRTRRGPVPDFTVGLEDGVRGLRVGAVRDDGSPLGPPDDDALAAFDAGLRALAEAGAAIVDLTLPEMEALRVIGSPLINLEAVTYHEPYLRNQQQNLGQFLRDRLRVAYGYGPTAYVQAQQTRAVLRARLNDLFERVDVVATPAMPSGALPLGTPHSTRYTIPFNGLGWPAIVVPTGQTAIGLPLAIQIAGRPWDEASVLRAGRAVERAGLWDGKRPPGF